MKLTDTNDHLLEWDAPVPSWLGPSIRLVISGICQRCAEDADIMPSALFWPHRGPQIVADARIIAMAEVRRVTALPYVTIGEIFGGRDHSTVMWACKRAQERGEVV